MGTAIAFIPPSILPGFCLKVCIDPGCEEVAFNIDKKETRCRNCNGRLVEINQKTYDKKFINNFFQYDYRDGKLLTLAAPSTVQ